MDMTIGIASDHGGFELKQIIVKYLKSLNFKVIDFGNTVNDTTDDYPDYAVPLAWAITKGEVQRGIAICGSGVGISIAVNKVEGIRAALVHDLFSARQGVEDDDMNILCLGGRVITVEVALELIDTFLKAKFSGIKRHVRRLKKVKDLEDHFGMVPISQNFKIKI